MAKEFKVAAISKEPDNMGLHAMVLVAKDGESWKAGVKVDIRKKGDIITLDESWTALGYQLAEQMSTCPSHMLKLIWGVSVVDRYAPVSGFKKN